jgi:hypothetical protein
VDLDAAPDSYPQARVVRQVISVGGRIQRGEPKTENGRRVVALDPTVVAALKAWRAEQAAERLATGPAWVGDAEIFTREDGRALYLGTSASASSGHIQADNRLAAALLLAARLDG